MFHLGKQSIRFENCPSILSSAAIAGRKEGQGPLRDYFDYIGQDPRLSQDTWEKAERKLQELALDTARRKAGLKTENIDILFAGDLLNQCITSSFAVRDTQIPFFRADRLPRSASLFTTNSEISTQ